MLKGFVARIGAGLGAALLMACAAMISLVAAAFALYAVLRLGLSAAGAAALTALAFGVLAAVLGMLTPRLLRGEERAARPKPSLKDTARTAARVGAAGAGILAQLILDQIPERNKKSPRAKPLRR
ncbi:MAG: hypothetical protein H0X27_11535 [Caulobacteraceae bacterium]|nr:hypothetical protein [Caulobacteraceae bacterium]